MRNLLLESFHFFLVNPVITHYKTFTVMYIENATLIGLIVSEFSML